MRSLSEIRKEGGQEGESREGRKEGQKEGRKRQTKGKAEVQQTEMLLLPLLTYLQGQRWTEKPKVVRARNWGSFVHLFPSLGGPEYPALLSV